MNLPNADRASVDIVKLEGYCLNAEHPEGKHKARVFQTSIGFTKSNAQELKLLLLAAAKSGDAALHNKDQYGQRYYLDFTIQNNVGCAIIRSGWIIRVGEDFPRLTTCFVLREC
jgi:hypothetical protein